MTDGKTWHLQAIHRGYYCRNYYCYCLGLDIKESLISMGISTQCNIFVVHFVIYIIFCNYLRIINNSCRCPGPRNTLVLFFKKKQNQVLNYLIGWYLHSEQPNYRETSSYVQFISREVRRGHNIHDKTVRFARLTRSETSFTEGMEKKCSSR